MYLIFIDIHPIVLGIPENVSSMRYVVSTQQYAVIQCEPLIQSV